MAVYSGKWRAALRRHLSLHGLPARDRFGLHLLRCLASRPVRASRRNIQIQRTKLLCPLRVAAIRGQREKGWNQARRFVGSAHCVGAHLWGLGQTSRTLAATDRGRRTVRGRPGV